MTTAQKTVALPAKAENRLQEYAKLQAKIKELDAVADALKIDIMADFHANNIEEPIHSPFGTFALGSRKTYQYSKRVLTLEDEVKQLKRNEEDSGKAKVVKLSEYLTYRV